MHMVLISYRYIVEVPLLLELTSLGFYQVREDGRLYESVISFMRSLLIIKSLESMFASFKDTRRVLS